MREVREFLNKGGRWGHMGEGLGQLATAVGGKDLTVSQKGRAGRGEGLGFQFSSLHITGGINHPRAAVTPPFIFFYIKVSRPLILSIHALSRKRLEILII